MVKQLTIKATSLLFALPSMLCFYNCFDKETISQAKYFSLSDSSLCNKAKEGTAIANWLYQSNVFSKAKAALERAAKDRREHSITFGTEGDSIKASAVRDGDITRGKVISDWPGAFADIHNHNNHQPPSAGDLYYLIKLANNKAAYRTRFVITPGGEVFALYVYDLKLANDFIVGYPPERSEGFSPRFPEPLFDEFDKASIYFERQGENRLVAQERAMAFVLDKYGAGVVLLKQGANGSFNLVQVKEVMDKGKRIFVVKECW